MHQNLEFFAGRNILSKHRGKICMWNNQSNDATDTVIDLWSVEIIQFKESIAGESYVRKGWFEQNKH